MPCRTSKDARMKRVTEAFKAISIVKFNAWEDKMMERITETRAVELRDLWDYRLGITASIVLMWGMPVFISMVSFGTYAVLLGRELTSVIVFTSLTLFAMLQDPLRMIADILSTIIQATVGLERISASLAMDEVEGFNAVDIDDSHADQYIEKKVIVSIENATFGWDNENVVLRNVNLQVRSGDFYVVHGTVGCDKSSLCSALLGEMVKQSGSVYVGGSIAYCSQQPWIQNMTVRDNIIFRTPFSHVGTSSAEHVERLATPGSYECVSSYCPLMMRRGKCSWWRGRLLVHTSCQVEDAG